jgi:CBS domain-containing protein
MTSVRAILEARETVTVGPQVSVLDVARLMVTHRISAIPVVDRDRLVGIFTERDILARVVAVRLDPAATAVAEVMTKDLVVADVTESYVVCLQRMQRALVRHLIVLDRGRLAGILSMRDLMAVDLTEKDEAITLLNAYVHYIPADLQAKTHSS